MTPASVSVLPVRAPSRLLSKRELAAELGLSRRWIELRMREGLPVVPRAHHGEQARFDLAQVRAWLDARADQPARPSLEQRVHELERAVDTLAAQLDRRSA